MKVRIRFKDVMEGRMPEGTGISPDMPFPAGRSVRLFLEKTGGTPYHRLAQWDADVEQDNFDDSPWGVKVGRADGYNQYEPSLRVPRMDDADEGERSIVTVRVNVEEPRGRGSDSVTLYFAKNAQRIFPKVSRDKLRERLSKVKDDVNSIIEDLEDSLQS